jgi:hypothetical protein
MTAQVFPNLISGAVSTEVVVPAHLAETYSIGSLNLLLKNGGSISLIDVFMKVELFEDIFNPSISGYVEIKDFVGGLEKFQLTGGEIISISVFKPETTTPVIMRNDLVVHTINRVKFDAQNSVTYQLQFTTKAAVNSQKQRVFKSYGQQRNIGAIVQDLYNALEAPYAINYQTPSIGLSKAFVVPGYTPIQAINYLAKRSGADTDYFLFFERVNCGYRGGNFTHVFAGINKLRGLSPASNQSTYNDRIHNIVYHPSIGYTTEQGAETYVKAKSLEFQNNYNHLINMNHGFYKSRLNSLNLKNRTYESKTFSYKEGLNDFYINELVTDTNIFGRFNNDQFPGERLFTAGVNDPVENKSRWVEYDLHGALLMSGVRIVVDISGSTNVIGAGDIVNLSIPGSYAKTYNLGQSEVAEDNMYSGKYFVSACRHTLTPFNYTKKLELSRGSTRQKLARP